MCTWTWLYGGLGFLGVGTLGFFLAALCQAAKPGDETIVQGPRGVR